MPPGPDLHRVPEPESRGEDTAAVLADLPLYFLHGGLTQKVCWPFAWSQFSRASPELIHETDVRLIEAGTRSNTLLQRNLMTDDRGREQAVC